ncbi:MAG: hypothetical protein AB3P11_07425 [Wolbachia pipientis]
MLPGFFLSDENKINSGTTIIKKDCIDIERILDKLEEEQAMEDMLDIEEIGKVKEVNKFQSKKEVEKYLKQETYDWYLTQLSKIHSEHNYANLKGVAKLKPRSKIYNLREIRKFKKEIIVNK